MTQYSCMSKSELQTEYQSVLRAFEECKARGLNLNMARGKPSKEQLDMAQDLLTCVQTNDACIVDGVDVRNYGEAAGLAIAREYWADVLQCGVENVFVGGVASLQLMYDVISCAYTHGLPNSPRPWCAEEKIKFLCPVPGYDRHFKIGEFFGAELIPIPMNADGPDMDLVESYVKDPSVKLIWTVPKYSNPDGITYSEEIIRRFANLKPAAPDFTIMWDNAYYVHQFEGDFVPMADIISLCAQAGRANMVIEFASTSKITFAGGGISCMAASAENIAFFSKVFGIRMICNDKLNQLRHVRYLKNKEHTLELMKRHAAILAPKFRTVSEWLGRELAPCGIAHWSEPKGGYFVSLYVMPGTATRVWELCRETGVILTDPGAAFPYGHDPLDEHLRIAPSFPPISELEEAMQVLTVSTKLAALEKLLT